MLMLVVKGAPSMALRSLRVEIRVNGEAELGVSQLSVKSLIRIREI